MKKLLKGFLLLVAIISITACSGSTSFSAEKCKALEEKVNAKEELSEADYTEMIDQMGAIVSCLKEKYNEFGDDEAKKKEFIKTPEARDMAGYIFKFGLYLDSHSDQLSNSNKRKLNKVVEQLNDENIKR